MATRLVKLRGIAYYPKVFETNRDLTGFDNALVDIGGQTTIDVDLDERHIALLQRSKSMLRGSPSPENQGLTRVKFKRKWQEKFGGGEPRVIRADDTSWDLNTDGMIGNGSEVEVTIAVYDTSRKNIVGSRLDSVKVLKHVPYEGGSKIEVMTVDDVGPAPKAAPKQTQLADDEIPF
jgi:hypothetical protein